MIYDSEPRQWVHFSPEKSDFDPTRKYLILSIVNLRKVAFLQTQRTRSAVVI